MREYPQIYDKSHALYKRTDINGPLLEEIAKLITPHPVKGPLSGPEVQSKWKSLVDKYRTKIDASGSAGTPINEKAANWQWFKEMSFMKAYVGSRT